MTLLVFDLLALVRFFYASFWRVFLPMRQSFLKFLFAFWFFTHQEIAVWEVGTSVKDFSATARFFFHNVTDWSSSLFLATKAFKTGFVPNFSNALAFGVILASQEVTKTSSADNHWFTANWAKFSFGFFLQFFYFRFFFRQWFGGFTFQIGAS